MAKDNLYCSLCRCYHKKNSRLAKVHKEYLTSWEKVNDKKEVKNGVSTKRQSQVPQVAS